MAKAEAQWMTGQKPQNLTGRIPGSKSVKYAKLHSELFD